MLSKILALVSLFGSLHALANDTAVAVSAGGLQFIKAERIKLLSEKLSISVDKVKVAYQFQNIDSKDQEIKVAFPLPEIEWQKMQTFSADEMYRLYTYLEGNGGEGYFGNLKRYFEMGATFADFSLRVDGKLRSFNYRYSAKGADGKDLTGILRDNDLPLSMSYLNGWEEEGALERNPRWKKRLGDLGLLNSEGRAAWTNQMTYFWSDTFPPGKAHAVEHEYRPATGSNWVSSQEPVKSLSDIKIAGGDWDWKDYCPSKEMEKHLVGVVSKHLAKAGKKALGLQREAYPQVKEVRYILTTANNWEGPIGNFELEVIPTSKDTLVSFCWPTPFRQGKDGRVRIREKNFSPKQDLRILLVEPNHVVMGK